MLQVNPSHFHSNAIYWYFFLVSFFLSFGLVGCPGNYDGRTWLKTIKSKQNASTIYCCSCRWVFEFNYWLHRRIFFLLQRLTFDIENKWNSDSSNESNLVKCQQIMHFYYYYLLRPNLIDLRAHERISILVVCINCVALIRNAIFDMWMTRQYSR